MSSLLIVFCKNPVLGKVKTRLAKNIGNNQALEIYKKLLNRTHEVASGATCDFAVYYSEFIEENDIWDDATYKEVQNGKDIGLRMGNAIKDALDKGYESVVLIGADIYTLTSEIIDRAFDNLSKADVVLGPAEDGGYYLVGMQKPHKIFNLSAWSTPNVLRETIDKVESNGLTYDLIDELNDIDLLEDLKDTDLFQSISIPPNHE